MNKKQKIWILFTVVMLFFLGGMVYLLINKIENIFVWIGYITLWSWVEHEIAKPLRLQSKTWLLILTLIIMVDVVVIWLVS
ncbi:hypothetical protein [Aquimarina sp. 2201CG5-10]|uniref:hypothetical protein n=1 Tax=Aquimarina callyspongiae TaxID=3098150 RepID=UPI002AB49F0C|nr:hypothetical protein [Aquimarina sp. 2201CG5-10]MDY8136025.1 hypothetical protein [Aquimarina sp. 2201CG5-10]